MTKRLSPISEVKKVLGLGPRAPMSHVMHALSYHYGLANIPFRFRKTHWYRKRVQSIRYIMALDAGDDD